MTQILKKRLTVALASVSSNLPAPQRRQTNWLASGALRGGVGQGGWGRVVEGVGVCLVDRSCQGKFGDEPAGLGKCKHNFCVRMDKVPSNEMQIHTHA